MPPPRDKPHEPYPSAAMRHDPAALADRLRRVRAYAGIHISVGDQNAMLEAADALERLTSATRVGEIRAAFEKIEPLIEAAHKSAVNKAVYLPLQEALQAVREALAASPINSATDAAQDAARLRWLIEQGEDAFEVISCWEPSVWREKIDKAMAAKPEASEPKA